MASEEALQLAALEPDWAAVPTDILSLVFAHLLQPPPAAGADAAGDPSARQCGLPLRPLVHQYFTLALTCRHWAEVAASVPLSVELYAAPQPCLAWLAQRSVRLLQLHSGPAAAAAEAADARLLGLLEGSGGCATAAALAAAERERVLGQLAAPPAQPLSAFRRDRSLGWEPEAAELYPWVAAAAGHSLSFDGMVGELEGVVQHATPATQAPPRPAWTLAAFSRLEVLCLEGPVSWHGDFSSFRAAPLAGLARLRELSLRCFYSYDLSGLPPALRRLRLHFEPFLFPEHAPLGMQFSFSLLSLPATARLDELILECSQGSIGLAWGAAAAACRRLVLHSGLEEEGEQRAAALVAVPLQPGQERRWAELYQRTQASREQQRAAQEAAVAAWLADFAVNSSNLLEEIVLGALPCEFRLLPVPAGSSTQAAESALRGYHASCMAAQLDQDFFPPLPASLTLEEAARRCPQQLRCTEAAAARRPGLVALARRGGDAGERSGQGSCH